MATADHESSGLTVKHDQGNKEGVRVWELPFPWGTQNMKRIDIVQNKHLFLADKLVKIAEVILDPLYLSTVLGSLIQMLPLPFTLPFL